MTVGSKEGLLLQRDCFRGTVSQDLLQRDCVTGRTGPTSAKGYWRETAKGYWRETAEEGLCRAEAPCCSHASKKNYKFSDLCADAESPAYLYTIPPHIALKRPVFDVKGFLRVSLSKI